MPKPTTAAQWIERIRTLAAAPEHPSVAAIAAQLEIQAANDGALGDAPKERTVRRYVEEFRKLPEADRQQYAVARWPESMMSGALPWESSRDVLDLFGHWERFKRGRPTVRHAKWFWRIRMAAPSIPIGSADRYAAVLSTNEFASVLGFPNAAEMPSLEWAMTYQQWTDTDKDHVADEAIDAATKIC